MDRTQMEDFVANAALLAAHLTRQCEQAVAEQRASIHRLQATATEMAVGASSAADALRQVADHAVRDALASHAAATTSRAENAATRLDRTVAQAERAHARAVAGTRRLGAGLLLTLALGGAGIVVATAALARENLARAERAQVRADVLAALRHVAITSCDGRPCIKLEDGLRRWHANDAYVMVDDTPVAP